MPRALILAFASCFALSCPRFAQAQARHHLAPQKPKPPAHAEDKKPEPASAPPAPEPNTATGAEAEQPALELRPSSPAQPPAAAPAEAATAGAAGAKEPLAAPDGGGELAGLRQELSQVMDDMVQARARVAVLGKTLWKTRVRVKLDNRAAPDQVAVHATLFLDGAPIWNGDGTAMRGPDHPLFDGFAAPGPHVLTVEVEQRAREDENYRYTVRNGYRFMVVREKRTDVLLVLDDDSDMAEDFKDDESGEYDVRTRLKVRAVDLNEE